PSETTAPIGSPVRSARSSGSSLSPAFFRVFEISGSCCGTHMPSPASTLPGAVVARFAAAAVAAARRVRRMACFLLSWFVWFGSTWCARLLRRQAHLPEQLRRRIDPGQQPAQVARVDVDRALVARVVHPAGADRFPVAVEVQADQAAVG